MKTDNINTKYSYLPTAEENFKAGAIWQQQKDEAIIDNLVNALKIIAESYYELQHELNPHLGTDIYSPEYNAAMKLLKEIESDKQ